MIKGNYFEVVSPHTKEGKCKIVAQNIYNGAGGGVGVWNDEIGSLGGWKGTGGWKDERMRSRNVRRKES
jgi:hypothetical protein